MFIIAQVNEKCNDEISKVGMAEVIQTLQDGGRLNDLIAVEILKGSNEKALDILRVCGCKAVIPGTMFAPLTEVARFYQCRPSYLQTVLNRVGITPTKTPADVMKCGFSNFLVYFNLGKKFRVSSRYCDHTLTDLETNQKYEFTHSNSAGANFYSARVVLALAMLMYFGRTVNTDVMSGEIYERLLSSTYHDAAQRAIAERRIQQQAEVKAAVPDNNTAVMSDGKVTMTADFLAGLIKTAVHEAVAEFAKTVTPAAPAVAESPPTSPAPTGSRPRLSKPDNWDFIIAQYDAGAITRTNAAHQAGMSVVSFDNYRKGLRHFVS